MQRAGICPVQEMFGDRQGKRYGLFRLRGRERVAMFIVQRRRKGEVSELKITGFELIEKLGAGGMASVWKARQISLDRIVAIKILYSKLAGDPNEVKQFQAEAQTAAKLKHPGIVQVYDANAESGFY